MDSNAPGISVGRRDLAAFARGCAVLGSGGGGGVELAQLLVRDELARSGPVGVVDLDDLAADALVMPCGMMGSPLIFEERLPIREAPFELLAAVQDAYGRPVDALMPFQLAGANGLIPLAWAAALGLPLVDADGTGRPMSNMGTVMALAGVMPTPACMVDGDGQRITIRARTRERFVTAAFGALAGVSGLGAIAFDLMDGGTARRATIRGSVTRALAIGRASLAHHGVGEGALTGGRELIRGHIQQIERYRPEQRTGGSLLIKAVDRPALVRLEFQDVFLLALNQGRVVAATPDTIALLDTESGRPLMIDELAVDQFVTAIAGDGPAAWRTSDGLNTAGPTAFGMEVLDGFTQ